MKIIPLMIEDRNSGRVEVTNEHLNREKKVLEQQVSKLNKELVNHAALLIKKNELLEAAKNCLKKVRPQLKNPSTQQTITTIMRKINVNINSKHHQEGVFDTNFEKVHESLFRMLTERYPDIKQKDLKLCGLISMNLANKDIAPLLGISVRGVEAARYRLRKVLQLDKQMPTVRFLENFKQEKRFTIL